MKLRYQLICCLAEIWNWFTGVRIPRDPNAVTLCPAGDWARPCPFTPQCKGKCRKA